MIPDRGVGGRVNAMAEQTASPPASTRSHPDGWRQLRSAGAYDWWYVDALDLRGEQPLSVVAIFYAGFPFTPAYYSARAQRASAAEAAQRPFQLSRDPLDHAGVSLTVTQGDVTLTTGVMEVARDRFTACTDRADVSVDACRLWEDEAGRLHVRVEMDAIGLGRRLRSPGWDQRVRLDLCLTPLGGPPWPSPRRLHATPLAWHEWACVMPRCQVTGQVCREGAFAGQQEIRGLGYHDHNAGTRPVADDVRRWSWSRVVSDGLAAVWYDSLGKDGQPSRLLAWQGGSADSPWHVTSVPDAQVTRWRTSLLGVRCPAVTELRHRGPEGELALTQRWGQTIELAPFYSRCLTQVSATVNDCHGHRKVEATGVAEQLSPGRLRWPIVQAMLRTRMRYVGG